MLTQSRAIRADDGDMAVALCGACTGIAYMSEFVPSRDIWTHGGGWPLPDLLRSALASLLLRGPTHRAVYFASPWITDFALFDNRFRDYAALFPRLADTPWIHFSDYLHLLAQTIEVRLVTTRNERSDAFLDMPLIRGTANMNARTGHASFHEKGILAPSFYIEGSMNLTRHGVHLRGEKVVYHTALSDPLPAKLANAYLEFDRNWASMAL
ncbi:hypothetical protein YP76_03885 [Sphingobium chungbukense]|uniref:Phospholipase D-like domain-containing protein n=2 Tax=Sphingobium chungbukense TaxID=56193 RepID=A0A0M3AUE9_9SPHN|nr:hypothetical protein YP76_03885 [Sphingobium chungbukense]